MLRYQRNERRDVGIQVTLFLSDRDEATHFDRRKTPYHLIRGFFNPIAKATQDS